MSEAVSDREYSKRVIARLHGMTRVRICRTRCAICFLLPRDNPPPPTAENNVLIAMREQRIRDEAEREAIIAQAPGAAWAIAEGQVRGLPTLQTVVRLSHQPHDRGLEVCPVPETPGIVWAAVQRLVAHAWDDGGTESLCGKRRRHQADWTRATAPNWCRECQVAVLRLLGRDVYVAGNEIRERSATGTRKLARAERSR